MREDGFLAGAFSGAVGSVVNSAFLSVGNHHYFKDPVFAWTDYAQSAFWGGVTGGITNGLTAVAQGNNFWTGKPITAGNTPIVINTTSTTDQSLTNVEGRQVIDIDNKPIQNHHFATDKNKMFTPQMKEIVSKYGLELNDKWNIEPLPHIGRHPNMYHQWVLEEMRFIDQIPNMNQSQFIYNFNLRIIQPIRNNKEMLYKNYWQQLFKP